jgi:hypothetical protein
MGARCGPCRDRTERILAVPKRASPAEGFYARAPYADAFDIDYPQENLEGEMYKYRCCYCKRLSTDINGRLENHASDCEYRLRRSAPGSTPEPGLSPARN